MSGKADHGQFNAALRRRFIAQLNPLEAQVLADSQVLELCFTYYMEGYMLALVPEYDDVDGLTGCADDGDALSLALRKITPERLNEILKEKLGERR